jgi:hypothetical protein
MRRALLDGSWDMSFGPGGVVSGPSVGASSWLSIATSGEAVVVVDWQYPKKKSFVRRFTESGKVDKSFGVKGAATLTWPGSNVRYGLVINVDSVGRYIVSMQRSDGRVGFVRLSSNGRVDQSFAQKGRLDAGASQLAFPWAYIGKSGTLLVVDYVIEGVAPIARVRSYNEQGVLNSSFGQSGTLMIGNTARYTALVDAVTLADGSTIMVGTTSGITPTGVGIDELIGTDALAVRFDASGVVGGLDGDGIVEIDTGAMCTGISFA